MHKFVKSLFVVNRHKSFVQQFSTQRPPTDYQSQNYSFECIAHYEQICKCLGQGGYLSVLPSYPLFQVNKKNNVAVKQRYPRSNYIYLMRFQFTQENSNKELVVQETFNFPITFDNLGEFLFFNDLDTQFILQETTNKGDVKLKVSVKEKRVELVLGLNHGDRTITISLSQYKLLMEAMKQGLPIVTGWNVPDQFLNQIEYVKKE